MHRSISWLNVTNMAFTRIDHTPEEFVERLLAYCEIVKLLNEERAIGMSYSAEVTTEFGRKYVKVKVGTRVHTFIDVATGRIYRAATYKAVAKDGWRGSIWKNDNGAGVINWFGAKDLR